MNLTTNELDDNPSPYIDERVTVTPIPLILDPPSPKPKPATASSFSTQFKFPTPPIEGTPQEKLAHKQRIVQEMFKRGVYDEDMDEATLSARLNQARRHRAATTNINLPPTEPSLTSMAYFVKNRDLPGKFDLDKARALKVPVGGLFRELKNGKSVQIEVEENGERLQKTIQPEQVLGPPVSGKSVLILDIPGPKYMEKLLANETLNSEMVKEASVVVHMLSDDVATHTKYIQWMESFSSSTQV